MKREELISMEVPENMLYVYPRHTLVNKCGGSCRKLSDSCISIQSKKIQISLTGNQS